MTESDARRALAAIPEWTAEASARIERLTALLAEENVQQNLVAAATLDQVWTRHILDSAQLLRFVPDEASSAMDLGSGAGFPGLVLAILRPSMTVTLVESRAKRVGWLTRAAQLLGIENVTIFPGRLETISSHPADVISARAFAPLPRLIEMAARFSTSETLWLLPKGRSARQELASLSGWSHTFHVEQSLTDAAAGLIVGRLAGKKGKRL